MLHHITSDQDQATPAAVRSLLSEDQDTPKACLASQMCHITSRIWIFLTNLHLSPGGNLFEEQDGGLILPDFIVTQKNNHRVIPILRLKKETFWAKCHSNTGAASFFSAQYDANKVSIQAFQEMEYRKLFNNTSTDFPTSVASCNGFCHRYPFKLMFRV